MVITNIEICIGAAEIPERFRSAATAELVDLEAMAQALADVRTLDDWQAALRGRSVSQWTHEPQSYCELIDCHTTLTVEYGATPDEARAKAAAWVREQRAGT